MGESALSWIRGVASLNPLSNLHNFNVGSESYNIYGLMHRMTFPHPYVLTLTLTLSPWDFLEK